MARKDLPDESYIEAAKAALTRPDSFLYYGSNDELFDTWGMLPFVQHRDSDVLDRSNYRTILDELKGHAVWEDCDGAEDSSEMVDDFSASCWLHGWREQITCRVLIDGNRLVGIDNLTDTFKASVEIQHALMDYPIFDESDYSELESEESWAAFEEAWSSVDWEEVSPNHDDDDMKSAVYRELTECETRDWFSDDEITEAVIAWTEEIAWEDYARTYANQLRLFELA